MSYSYLSTYLCIACDSVAVESALRGRVRMPTTLRSSLDAALTPLRLPTDDLLHFPDGPWLEAHLEYLSQLTYWELWLLRSHVARTSTQMIPRASDRREHLLTSAYEIAYLAFAYADAALAEHLAALLPQNECGLFVFAAHGESSEGCFILSAESMTAIDRPQMPGERHPIVNWLSNPSFELTRDLPTWEKLERREAEESAHTLRAQWRDFVDAQDKQARRAAATKRGNLLKLGSSHFTDGKQVWFGNPTQLDEAVLLEACDLSTFKEHVDGEGVGHYATDHAHLWSWGNLLPCVAPEQFGPCAWNRFFYTDGVHLYKDDVVIDGVDARQIRLIREPAEQNALDHCEGFVHGEEFYWVYGSWPSASVDGATFRALGDRYFVDLHHVYHCDDGVMIVEDFDPATIRLVNHSEHRYLLDANKVALERGNGYQPIRLKGADPATFRVLSELPFVADARRVWLGHKVCKELDATTLALPRKHAEYPAKSAWDTSRYFVSRGVVYKWESSYDDYAPHACDAASFEVLDVPLARDAQHVWYWGKLLESANSRGVRWLDERRLWTDGQRVFDSEERRPDAWLSAAEAGQIEHPMHGLVRVATQFYLNGDAIAGWHSDTHHLGGFDCMADAQYYFTIPSAQYGPIAVWSPDVHSALPLATYEHDAATSTWRCNADLPALQRLAPPPLLTREEFDTLLDCLPSLDEHATTTWTLIDPAAEMTRQAGLYPVVELRGAVRCRCTFSATEQRVVTSVLPVDSLVARLAARTQLERFLRMTPPLSFELLAQLEQRIPNSDSLAQFEFSGCHLLIQNGTDNLRGVWLDERISNDRVERAAVFVQDSGFFDTWHGAGPADAFADLNDAAFVVHGWDEQRRERFRQHIATFLQDTPAGRNPGCRAWT